MLTPPLHKSAECTKPLFPDMMMAPLLDEDEDFQLLRIHDGVKTLQTQDTSDPRHFGTGAKLSGHIGTSVKVS